MIFNFLYEKISLWSLPDTQPIIILGMHRSGTTLLTKMLAECGIHFGKNLDRNHESQTFKSINEFILKSTGGNWDYPVSAEVLDYDLSLRRLYIQYVFNQIRSPRCIGYLGWKAIVNSKPTHWGWKDPRNCFTLGIWREIYPECKVILIERHGLDVSISITKRRQKFLLENVKKFKSRYYFYTFLAKRGTFVDTARCWSLLEGVKLWAEYFDKARMEVSKLNSHLSIRYEDFLSYPEKYIKRILNYLDVKFDENQIRKICAQVNPERAFAYRKNDLFLRLNTEEKEEIRKIIYKSGYYID